MGYYVDAKGKRLALDGACHELYAKNVLKSELKKVLKTHIRVAMFKDQMAFETDQKVLTIKQKHELNLIYREHHCRGYTSRISDNVFKSDCFKTVHKINYHKCTGKY